MEGSVIGLAFDISLALMLIVCAGAAITSAKLMQGIVFFIVFGLLLALAWLRLRAPDVALAEAAVGVGLTGVLLVEALAAVRRHAGLQTTLSGRRRSKGPLVGVMAGLTLLLGLALVLAVTVIPRREGIELWVDAALPISGVKHGVTAVLLNFRSWDTLLEVGVLLAAVAASRALSIEPRPGSRSRSVANDNLIEDWLLPRLIVVAIVMAMYLYWAGSSRPGGAFQGGTVLAAAGVLGLMSGHLRSWLNHRLWLGAAALGLATFVVVGILTLVSTGNFLSYPAAASGALIMFIELMLTLSIAVCLVELVGVGYRSVEKSP